MARVRARAKMHEDRAGDPLDGLVNLFDLGIVLAVAFLLAALSSIELTPNALEENRQQQEQREPQTQAQSDRSVVVGKDEQARELQLKPGEKVVGSGEPVGTVYRLDDGRTILVRPNEQPPAGASSGAGQSGGTATTPPAGTATTPGG
ncbi:MAG TPA: DUF2149 domain-containing protein [Solirubrobacteraceae bacterium]|nr:DUF2149 domain-containing protein [Solirubrobacteraceae bacterium]